MSHLGTIRLRDEISVREARGKVRGVAEAIGYTTVEATRLATATSEAARACLQESTAPLITLTLALQGAEVRLVLEFEDPVALPPLDHLSGFFDRLEAPRRRSEETVVQAVASAIVPPSPLSGRLGDLRAIVEKKGREELLAEIRSKNVELQESLDNLRRTRSAKERMESELNIGREIQMSMLPFQFPAFPERSDFDVHAVLHPAREVGGDFYDLFLIDDDHFCFCVGDVSGKGVPAALFMAVTKTLIKSRAANDLSPASILSHVNSELSQRNESCMFVTVFLGIVDLRRGVLTYGNAGHNPPYLLRGDDAPLRIDQRHGPVIGAADGLAYGQDEIDLRAGDLLFVYTDGVTEAMDRDQSLYSEDRLFALLAARPLSSAEEAVEVGVEDVWSFQGDAEQADDVTILSVRFQGRGEDAEAHRLELRLRNRLEEIGRAHEAIAEFSEDHGLAAKTRRTLGMVFDELLNNTISYAYDDDEEHEIEVTVSVSEGRLRATLSDDGRPFNPFDNQQPDTALSVEDRPIGGLGIHLVRNVMDRFAYERRGSSNVVILEKKLDSSEE